MTSVATLARPVQHDINNLLTVVFANLELLKRTAAPGGPQRQLDRIQEAAKRLEGSTRALLSMLRRPTGQETRLRLSELVSAIQPLLLLLLPTTGSLLLELAEEDAPVQVDRTAFEDALLTAAQEAAEVLPRNAGLRLVTEAREGEVGLAILHPDGLSLPALNRLASLAQRAGGRAELGTDGLRLTLQVMPDQD
ncbi:histidine kinase dimerization/phospho-acceptor domain-containing protein [Belnapia rosea]|uniref:histidine kinase dimerization/phospho-acceptor domain-containing protein n=1 Tax=Belnapia rosea TaxID=938405 RepID=UPI00088B55BD|nr:histidine kinase dimerization/phospho-acceptor domain-containing protein [Belnapia rosea]SDB71223.1 His Kinase A (phospho-acceptor) domain-containing protein [Belnapia rosea]